MATVAPIPLLEVDGHELGPLPPPRRAALGLADGGHVGVLAESRIEWGLSQLGAEIEALYG